MSTNYDPREASAAHFLAHQCGAEWFQLTVDKGGSYTVIVANHGMTLFTAQAIRNAGGTVLNCSDGDERVHFVQFTLPESEPQS